MMLLIDMDFPESQKIENIKSFCCGSSMICDSLKKLKQNFKLNSFEKIPSFIILITCVDVAFYYAVDDQSKRNLVYDSKNKKEFWRFLTYILVHKDAIHLYLNAAIQGFLGFPIEKEQGTLRCAALYFSGGLAGAFGTTTFSPPVVMAGASAAVYALLTSHFSNIILNYEAVDYAKCRIAAVAILTTSDVAHVICHVWLYNNENPRIEWVAHASGATTGLAMGFIIFHGISKSKRLFRVISLSAMAVIVLGCCLYLNQRKFFDLR